MTKPRWESIHDEALADIRFWLQEIWSYKLLLRKHPSDALGDIFREVIKGLKMALGCEVLGYEKIYGDKPDVKKMREEIEQ